MKKVLLASTALVMTAGVAVAQGRRALLLLRRSGSRALEETLGWTATVFHNDFDVKITLSGETDSGLTFGATMDLDELRGDSIDPDGNLSSVFVSGSFGTLTMGDTDGAFDWAMDDIVWGTAIADDHSSHAGWNGNSGLDGSVDGQENALRILVR